MFVLLCVLLEEGWPIYIICNLLYDKSFCAFIFFILACTLVYILEISEGYV